MTIMPSEVLWDTGAQERIIGRHHLERWSELVERSGLQINWRKEKFDVPGVYNRLESHMFQWVPQDVLEVCVYSWSSETSRL